MKLAKIGPTKLAVTGAILWGSGWLIGALAMSMQSVVLLYIGYGVIGGIGLGLGYVTPVATASKWFPDKKGFVTGMVVMGFGLGALIMSKLIAPGLMTNFNGILKGIPAGSFVDGKLVDASTKALLQGQLVNVFMYAGIILFIIALSAAVFMKNPPAGYVPAGFTPAAKSAAAQGGKTNLPSGDASCAINSSGCG